ncbi:uncharacterized protein DSM5745_01925 [Aspergillus mulundensis]|uniref:Pathway-specific nitrogen regulator n=1 Tax=Aspergillus mulundensis TaxID=1810919 RepID=A0A3D8SV29_9EURO|nr:hypothetical protein DSM5745_01925 [Aspergillus mulundensis]RDW90150.1 hypothetical protein DSM5745_01925 [Aspergillus mulundensis]
MEAPIEPQHSSLKEETDSSLLNETAAAYPAHPDPVDSEKQSEHSDQGSLKESMQITAQDSGYNSSGSSGHQSPVETPIGRVEDGELSRTRSRASSRTSISSIPASTLTNLPDETKQATMLEGQDYMTQPWNHHAPRTIHTIRQREATFRKLSSVRLMQMHTEDEGDDDYHLTPPRRRGSQRVSDISIRSAGSSPFKRSPFYSPTGAIAKPKAKKEYQLVLLHCTLLSPSLPVPGLIGHPKRQDILREVLPLVYWKRWKLLEEKIGSGVLRERGVLISHPEDGYDLLEERLLESLELQHPRLDHGHFIGRGETESDDEDRLAMEDSSTEDEGEECPDCGGRVVRQNTTRKWEVKVFAANGLMRAGAWAAAWKEMEKVDVEVGLWLPPDVRADLEKRLAEDLSHVDNGLPIALLQEPENIPVEPSVRALTPGPLKADTPLQVTQAHDGDLPPASPDDTTTRPQDNQKWDQYTPRLSDDIDLQTLLVNYIRILASDRRNITIVFLSVLVFFVGINSGSASHESNLRPFPSYIPEYTSSPVVSLQQSATQTWTEKTSSQTLSVATPDSTVILASTGATESFMGLDHVSVAPVEPSMAVLEAVLPSETDAAPVRSAEVISEKQEEPQLSEFDEKALPELDAETPPVEDTSPDSEEQGQSAFPSDIASDGLPPMEIANFEDSFTENTEPLSEEHEEPAQPNGFKREELLEGDTLLVEDTHPVSEEQEQSDHLGEGITDGLSPPEMDNLSIQSSESTSEKQEHTALLGENEPEKHLSAAEETSSFDYVHHNAKEEPSQPSETTLAEPLGTKLIVEDGGEDQTLLASDDHNQNEADVFAHQNDHHELTLPNEHNDNEKHDL